MPAHTLHNPDARTRGMAEMGSALGLPHQVIAEVIGISRFALQRHYKNELRTAATKVHLLAGKVIVERLKEGDLDAAKWWTSRRMGWADTNRTELTGLEGRPLPMFHISFEDGGPGEAPKRLPAPAQAEQALLATSKDSDGG